MLRKKYIKSRKSQFNQKSIQSFKPSILNQLKTVLSSKISYIMVDSGIKITNDCIEAYKGFHKAPQKHRFCVFGFNEKFDKVVLVHAAPLDATFEDLMVILSRHNACYIFYDCRYTNKEGHKRNKVSAKHKRTYSFSEALTKF